MPWDDGATLRAEGSLFGDFVEAVADTKVQVTFATVDAVRDIKETAGTITDIVSGDMDDQTKRLRERANEKLAAAGKPLIAQVPSAREQFFRQAPVALGEAYRDFQVMAANKATFGKIDPLNDHVQQLIADNGPLYAYADTSLTVARELLITAGTLGVGTVARGRCLAVFGMQVGGVGSKGWRLDFDPKDPNKGFHVNWWDHTAGEKRSSWIYGYVHVEGGTEAQVLDLLQHAFGNVHGE